MKLCCWSQVRHLWHLLEVGHTRTMHIADIGVIVPHPYLSSPLPHIHRELQAAQGQEPPASHLWCPHAPCQARLGWYLQGPVRPQPPQALRAARLFCQGDSLHCPALVQQPERPC